MVALQALACALLVAGASPASTAGGETVLLDFSASWCGPCRQMQPVVDQLSAAGHPVRKVDIDHEAALAAKYNVTGVPCFVMLVDGREVDRVVGATTQPRLLQMLAAARNPAPQAPTTLAASTAQPASRPLTPVVKPGAAPLVKIGSKTRSEIDRKLLAATVRLRINDGQGRSLGTGTIIDTRSGEALVLTCGHVFRSSKGKGAILVDLFGDQPKSGIPGQMVSYDLDRDVGLISIRPGVPVTAAPLADADYRPTPNDPVISVGCNHGADPTVIRTRVTSLDKYLGPANVQVEGQPVEGRSGGGLFTAEGRVMGVCNAADPTDNEGLFAAVPTIYELLNKVGLTEMLARSDEPPPAMPGRMPVAASQLSAAEQTALDAIAQRAEGAEVICIVRSLSNPQAKSEIVVLDRASPNFLQQLAADQQRQEQRHLTSLEVAATTPKPKPTWNTRRPAALPNAAPR
ncbi:MAG TPA: trypsin-like peptidase domain-containing protein [Pirellulales bacterium]|nr:trypsin-like peptidase domain-containing protein [Pirellulales bacterium]